jgi:hypothetical protein
MVDTMKNPREVREDLAPLVDGALHPGHHLSYAAFGIFAARVKILIEDHRRIEAELESCRAAST